MVLGLVYDFPDPYPYYVIKIESNDCAVLRLAFFSLDKVKEYGIIS